MSQAHPFHIEAFLLDNGTIDTTRYMLKVARGSIHPGVISAFLTEAIGQDTTVGGDNGAGVDPKHAHGYVRGSRAHAWVLPTEKVALFNEYLSKFNVMSLVNHFKALRAKIGPSTPKAPKPVLASVPMPDDDDDSYDGETDSDLD
jgi:hypothetical protein